MIGNLYPSLALTSTQFIFTSVSPVNVRSTSVATEQSNDVEWLATYSE